MRHRLARHPKRVTSDKRRFRQGLYLPGSQLSLVTAVSGGDDRIRTCEGLLTLNGLANRRLQPLGHISVPNQSENSF